MRQHVVLVVVGVQPVVAVRQHDPIQGRRLEAINGLKRKRQIPTPITINTVPTVIPIQTRVINLIGHNHDKMV